ncbi:hypothetical protein OG298_37530 [Streptomyces sp. NBC_01005]|uniref:hypothetical protein n=1 Tax=unclassified Streptomyces TaxID=2593676 RepID=UPI002E325C46|nr:hypothetical protein [Streptomyces sp. NBC_01362]WSW10915.1 hypothetical protein OG298_37530 [Streptomyces sp. NBC_01005]WTD00421.1 hypothetical protein OH736_37545 [Streptomyces sp. NBC_01650]
MTLPMGSTPGAAILLTSRMLNCPGAVQNVFWQFLGDPGLGSSVLDDLDALRAEAPHIRNVSLYRGWDSIEETPEYLFYRGVLKPFIHWRKERATGKS